MTRRSLPRTISAALVISVTGAAFAADPAGANPRPSPDGVWTLVDNLPQERAGAEPMVRPQIAQHLIMDPAAMQRQLERAPMEFTADAITFPLIVSLPMPDGTFKRFSIVETQVMHPELAAKFPEIKTYTGIGIDEDASSVRLDFTPHGFRGMVLAPSGSVFIDPWTKFDVTQYSSYYKRDYMGRDGWLCSAEELPENQAYLRRLSTDFGTTEPQREPGERAAAGLRTYRLANAVTGEYTAFHGGTVALGQAAVVTAINRVTGVYETELGIRLQLVANNSNLIYTNSATDPFSNTNGGAMLTQNQSTCDSVIGTANYDIGHVFSTGGGGVAGLGVVCVGGQKARGVTGQPSPTGDAFWIDYVAHEMGHQFGGSHTFNGANGACAGSQRSAANAYEPGSGSTIQAYAGICGADDLQPNSDAYFHSQSLAQMTAFINGTGGCRAFVTNGNNTPTVTVLSPAGLTIPANTPYELTASGSDPDGNPITYCWEQRNLGAALALSLGDNGTSPINRSFNPTTNPVRTVPPLATVLIGGTGTLGNILPTTTRNMSWRVTVRDNIPGGGGTGFADYSFQTTNAAGPFNVTSQNSGGSFTGSMTVTWNVANTNLSPVNATNVTIRLSTDGGNTFPTVLLASTPNDGSQVVTLPAVNTTTARVKVQGFNSIFFDINNSNFAITPTPPPGPFNLTTPSNGASGVALPVTLVWTSSSTATSYLVEVDTDFSFVAPLVYSNSTASTSQAVPGGVLTDNTTYYWRVTASNGATTVGSPNPSVFTTAAPPPNCPGDLDGDGNRNTVDLVQFLSFFGQSVTPGTNGDLDANGTVNTVDLVQFLSLFGVPCP